MKRPSTRRAFLRATTAAVVGGEILGFSRAHGQAPTTNPADPRPSGAVKVVVWDEQQPAQKEAYDNFLGNRIADHLRGQPGLSVRSVKLDDPEHGLAADVLENCSGLDLVGTRAAGGNHAGGRQGDRRADQGGRPRL